MVFIYIQILLKSKSLKEKGCVGMNEILLSTIRNFEFEHRES